MNFPTRSAALIFAAAATFAGVPQKAEAAPASNAQTVTEAIATFKKACNENITITKAVNIKLTTIAPSLMWKTCAAAEVANVTSQCIWANAHAVDEQAVKGTSNCLKQHAVAVVNDNYDKAKKIANQVANSSTGKAVVQTVDQQTKAAEKDYKKVKGTYTTAKKAVTKFFSSW